MIIFKGIWRFTEQDKMQQLTEKEQEARGRVCLALDGISKVDDALALARELAPYVGMVKIGKELHTIAGNEGRNIIGEVYQSGTNSFLDLKYLDTPKTVFGASKAAAVPGVYMFNIHVQEGNEVMCREAVEGAKEGADERGLERPKVIGVTVLTSIDKGAPDFQGLGVSYEDLVRRRAELAKLWGLDGIVCPANKAGMLERGFGYDFLKVTPGVSWKGKHGRGQQELYTPNLAVRDCSNSILVIGSAITKAGDIYGDGGKLIERGTPEDRQTAAYEILEAMAQEL